MPENDQIRDGRHAHLANKNRSEKIMIQYEYEVALSFAGEDRGFSEALAEGLKNSGVKVFYDNYYAEELWGQDLSTKLRDVYHGSSQFCIMIISEQYVQKMWPSHERQQAIERMIKQQGKTYILPVRLDGYNGEVPGMSGMIGYLGVKSSEHQAVVDAFLRKIGRQPGQQRPSTPAYAGPKPYIPKLEKSHTDKEKNDFLKSSFTEIVNLIDGYAEATKQEHPQFDYEAERITTRKALFTLYDNEKQITQFKIWIGGIIGGNSISFLNGQNIDVDSDNSMNESLTLEEREGLMMLKPMGMASFGSRGDKPLTPKEAADYLWGIAVKHL